MATCCADIGNRPHYSTNSTLCSTPRWRCGIQDRASQACIEQLAQTIAASGVELVRFAWCDQHGVLRGKTLVASAAARAMTEGVGMVGSLLLKDTSDRTAYKVFEPDDQAAPPGFAGAANLMLLADPQTYRQLPRAAHTGWVLCQPWFQDGTPVHLDTRRVLKQAWSRLGDAGHAMRRRLEVEFHSYRIAAAQGERISAPLDPELAAWPGLPPRVSMIHPGYNLLTEGFGAGFVDYFCTLKQSELDRHAQAQDQHDWERREYFSRY